MRARMYDEPATGFDIPTRLEIIEQVNAPDYMALCAEAEKKLRGMMRTVCHQELMSFEELEDWLGIGVVQDAPLYSLRWSIARISKRFNIGVGPSGRWLEVALPVRIGTLPKRPCCYVFISGGKAVYVGSTEWPRARMTDHAVKLDGSKFVTPWGSFKTLSLKIRPCRKYGDWAMVELCLIRKLQPIGNSRGIRNRQA